MGGTRAGASSPAASDPACGAPVRFVVVVDNARRRVGKHLRFFVGLEQGDHQLFYVLVTVFGKHGKTLHDRHFDLGADLNAELRRLFQRIVDEPLRRVVRRVAGDAFIDRRAQRVNVRPGALIAPASVLLLRRVAGLQQNGKALLILGRNTARRAEINNSALAKPCRIEEDQSAS